MKKTKTKDASALLSKSNDVASKIASLTNTVDEKTKTGKKTTMEKSKVKKEPENNNNSKRDRKEVGIAENDLKRERATTTVTPTTITTTSTTSTSLHKLAKANVSRAVNALLVNLANQQENRAKKPKLLDDEGEDEGFFFLQFGLKKIPDAALKTFKGREIALPHPFRKTDDALKNLCIFVKDKDEASKWLTDSNLKMRVISLQQLRTDFASFESKRLLSQQYEIFLADDRIVTMLPKALGKPFYSGSTKRPLPLRLAVKIGGNVSKQKDSFEPKEPRAFKGNPRLKERIVQVVNSTFFYLSGNCCTMKIAQANTNNAAQIVENIIASVDSVVEKGVPGKWSGLQSVFVKTTKSAALPLYECAPLLE